MNPAEARYQRALTCAKLSYLGILFPPAGVAFAFACTLVLKNLSPTTEQERWRIQRVALIALWGSLVSLWPLWILAMRYALTSPFSL